MDQGPGAVTTKSGTSTPFEHNLLEFNNSLLFQKASPELYANSLKKLLNLLPEAQSASLLLKQDNLYRFVASCGFEGKALQKLKIEEHELIRNSKLDLSQKQQANVDDTYLNELEQHRKVCLLEQEKLDLKTSLLLPVSVGPEVVAIVFLDRLEEGPFSKRLVSQARAASQQLAVILQHIRLQEHNSRQERELALLERVRSATETELDFSSLMRLAVNAIADVFENTHVNFYRLTGEAFQFYCYAGLSRVVDQLVPVTEGIMGRVAKQKTPVLIMDVQQDGKVASKFKDIISEIAVPVLDREQVIGVLRLQSSDGVVLGEADLNLMLAIRKQLHIAVSRSSLYSRSLKSEKRFRLLAENSSDIIALHSLTGEFLYVSPSCEKQLGYLPGNLVGKNILEFIHEDDSDNLQEGFKQLASVEMASHTYRFLGKNGHEVWLESSWQLTGEGNEAQHIVSSSRNITERKRFQDQLAYAAQHDNLTGLANRKAFMNQLDRVLAEREKNPSLRAAVLFLDLDRFKITNDSLGHSVGDILLKEFTKRLMTCVKTDDMVARFGGDEFAILLENLKSHSDAKSIAERIHKVLEDPFNLNGYEVFTSTSIGMAFINATTQTAGEVLRNADVAMYSAKRAGGSSFTVFNASMYQGYVERLNLEADLRLAIEENQLSLVYQPILDLASRELAGFEALLRWKHPELGYITPDKFVPIAEETGLILKVDDWVLEEACRQMVLWQRRYPKANDVFMSVNLSTRHLMLERAAQDLLHIVHTQGLETNCLKFEVTEGAVMTNADAGAAVLARFRSEGIKIQVDDFGTGYSSLSYLHKLPLDSLKIDRSFVQRMEGGRQDVEIIKTILSLANNLNLEVVAEGIETQYQLETLASMGVTHGQGYFIAKPLQPDVAAARFFAKKREMVFA